MARFNNCVRPQKQQTSHIPHNHHIRRCVSASDRLYSSSPAMRSNPFGGQDDEGQQPGFRDCPGRTEYRTDKNPAHCRNKKQYRMPTTSASHLHF